jgi:hypothetical protein
VVTIAGRIAAILGVLVALDSAPPALAQSAAVISACVKKSGALRVLVDPTKTCRKRESPITWSQTGTSGAPGAPGAPGEPGEKGDSGMEGPPGPSTGAASGDLTGNYPSPTVRLASSSVDGGQHTAFATSCTTLLTSVTVTVPPSGYIEVLAKVDLRANANTAIACIAATGIPSQQLMSTGSLVYETRYSVRGSTAGTTTAANVEWLPFFVAPGTLTISLYGGHTAGNTGTFQNATLLVRAIS